jgi:hypothetical protein
MLMRELRERRSRAVAQHAAGYALDDTPAASINRLLQPLDLSAIELRAHQRQALAYRYTRGEFDILGSGWLNLHDLSSPPGFEGYSYPSTTAEPTQAALPYRQRAEMQRLQTLLPQDYRPLPWHSDFKSGFCWPAGLWHGDIKYGDMPGVDVKVPWELGRLQHLPLLALATISKNTLAADCLSAWQRHLLDFMAHNPPGYGVQWSCTMDVAIRSANILLSADILAAHGVAIAHQINALLARSALEHGRHILHNIEWNPHLRGNHFLCNLAGLAFCASYLPADAETDSWLAYAAALLSLEVESQFDEFGCNFEGSTSYHRLSTEALLYTISVLSAIPRMRWHQVVSAPHRSLRFVAGWDETAANCLADWSQGPPAKLFQLCANAAAVTATLLLDGRSVPQIGDNDSGRFFKLDPACDGNPPVEDTQDHRHLISAAAGLLRLDGFSKMAEPFAIDCAVLASLAGVTPLVSAPAIPIPAHAALPGLGLYLWRKAEYSLIIRCGMVGQSGHGGHSHNDQLSFELWRGDTAIIVDPGTYTYTACAEWRNAFRSTSSHNAVQVPDREQANFCAETLFRLEGAEPGLVKTAEADSFIGTFKTEHYCHTRKLRLKSRLLELYDQCSVPEARLVLNLAPEIQVDRRSGVETLLKDADGTVLATLRGTDWTESPAWYSDAYGRRRPTHRITAPIDGTAISWTIEFPEK